MLPTLGYPAERRAQSAERRAQSAEQENTYSAATHAEATNYMLYKNVKKDLYNTKFYYNSIENEIFRIFQKLVMKGNINLFLNITRTLACEFIVFLIKFI